MACTTVRVGIKVTRWELKYNAFTFEMFHCRKKDKGDANHLATSDWIEEVIHDMPFTFSFDSIEKIPVGGSRRYWVHMTVYGGMDYWGEYDERVEVHSVKVCGRAT